MESIYSILICSLPFLASFAGYFLMIKRIGLLRMRAARVVCFILLALGVAFTAWEAIQTFSALGANSFNFRVIVVNVVIMVIISIIMASTEPEQ